MIVEKQMECRLAGKTEVLGQNLPQGHFCPSQNPTWPDPGLNPGRQAGKPATNSLSYGAALREALARVIGLEAEMRKLGPSNMKDFLEFDGNVHMHCRVE
jgi:hypothetical protein